MNHEPERSVGFATGVSQSAHNAEKGEGILGCKRNIAIFIFNLVATLQQHFSEWSSQDQEISIESLDSALQAVVNTDASGFSVIPIPDIDQLAPYSDR
ncbi:hypothetical protein VP1G_11130 [Cytospora mali]|uniref:Uncharacterized protein n=1 Tax=Cytospora mali TaxID=578113 RepID=A0A194V9I9_CYTMA|nr:hypothetical protein VP1G_11130 [Valsa mali var. pyri (nom. inval.)]